MPLCAYCKQDAFMTREHVIPAFMYAFQKSLESTVIGWNEVAGKMVPGEFKVKDVCAECNNGPLSNLDLFGKELLAHSGLMVPNYTRLSADLSFDFDLLARWLLKISFNSSRTDGAHAPLFAGLESYILGSSKARPRARFAIVSYLAGPSQLDKVERNRVPFSEVADKTGRFNPFVARICYGSVPGAANYTLRLVIIGPLVFYIPMFVPGVLPGYAASSVRNLLRWVPGGKWLKPGQRFVELKSGPKSWLDLYEHQVARVRAVEAGGQ